MGDESRGAALGFAGVVLAVAAALWIQKPDELTLTKLAAQTGRYSFAKAIIADPSPLRDPSLKSLTDLKTRWDSKRLAYASATDDDTRAAISAELEELAGLIRDIKWQASYHRFWNRFKLAMALMFVGAVITGVGLLVFAAQNETKAPAKPETAPTAVVIHLSTRGRTDLADAIGSTCVRRPVKAIALSSAVAGTDVVTVATARCEVVRFTLTNSLGVAMPSEPTTVR
jgi:stage V sporulation protein SpoVS